ncbi:hypothetical protein A2115_01525 [Candidatus Woesebacteria bacterium GWA1_41_8]|uniref:Methyltransferase type 11 domain-containing protein n=1 Tax=Candidatus Woesebacteria bacterium GWA1_41_8 TaxID=1802471 RepID=A0A1F7WH86_9BACT|nr:MAG: hypothetical protein A2115_01525 [Candidatus Woesebacteria bacterium GWA1_41_8]
MVNSKSKKEYVHSTQPYVSKWRIFQRLYFIDPCIRVLSRREGSVLDLGCGGGAVTRTLARRLPNHKFYGIDISPNAIKKAKEIPSNINFRQANAANLPYPRSYFSAVISLEVLEHLQNVRKVLEEVNRVLKTGGYFYFSTPLEGDSATLYGLLRNNFGYDPHLPLYGHVQKFSYNSLVDKLSKAGFGVLETTYCAHFLNQLYSLCLKFIEKRMPPKLRTMFIPVSAMASLVSGIESFLLRKARGGLNVQIACRKL